VIDATVGIRSVLDGFDRLRRTDSRKVFGASRRPMRDDVRDHAKQQSGPSGRWSPRAASTVERASHGRRRGGRGKLLGRLPRAIVVKATADSVRAESVVRWSQVHNLGGRAGKGARIPARRFMWISKALKKTVRDLFKAALARAWAGK